jgi:uncharacterized membrane protein SpoIIM required for sporulation
MLGEGDTSRFETLLGRHERARRSRLTLDEVRELAVSYRRHLAALARMQEAGDDRAALRHLNALCVRAHTVLYVEPARPGSRWARVRTLFPHVVARTWRAQAAAWTLLIAGLVVGLMLGTRDDAAVHALVPMSMCYGPEEFDRLMTSAEARAAFFERSAVPVASNMAFGSYLFMHNTKVGLLAFATGMLAGVPTLLLLLYNGLMLGGFSAIFVRDAWPIEYLAWILPHGIPELTAITTCGAAGLVLGAAIAMPGRLGMRRAVREAIAPAGLLFGASLPLFALAALTESFVRESLLPTGIRLAIAAAYAALLVWGLWGVRRTAVRERPDARWIDALIRPAPAGPRSG